MDLKKSCRNILNSGISARLIVLNQLAEWKYYVCSESLNVLYIVSCYHTFDNIGCIHPFCLKIDHFYRKIVLWSWKILEFCFFLKSPGSSIGKSIWTLMSLVCSSIRVCCCLSGWIQRRCWHWWRCHTASWTWCRLPTNFIHLSSHQNVWLHCVCMLHAFSNFYWSKV